MQNRSVMRRVLSAVAVVLALAVGAPAPLDVIGGWQGTGASHSVSHLAPTDHGADGWHHQAPDAASTPLIAALVPTGQAQTWHTTAEDTPPSGRLAWLTRERPLTAFQRPYDPPYLHAFSLLL